MAVSRDIPMLLPSSRTYLNTFFSILGVVVSKISAAPEEILIVPIAGNASVQGQLKELIDISQPVRVVVFRSSWSEYSLENMFLWNYVFRENHCETAGRDIRATVLGPFPTGRPPTCVTERTVFTPPAALVPML
jgi:hypothetical protein